MLRRGTIGLALLGACLALSAAGCGSDQDQQLLTAEQVTPDLTGADPRLGKLVDQGDQLLGGGKVAYVARLRSLRDLPVVANKWASWCVPCRAEAPILQRTARDLGNRVAFLGVNVNDSEDASFKFRMKYPMPYPSYADPNLKISALLPPADKQPVTAIYDARGRLVHLEIGAYETEAALRADINRYAGPIAPVKPR